MTLSNLAPLITYNVMSSFFLGCGLCYAFEQKKYYHIPMIILCPSMYIGYNLFSNRNTLISIIKP